jgi:hypothetical protein
MSHLVLKYKNNYADKNYGVKKFIFVSAVIVLWKAEKEKYNELIADDFSKKVISEYQRELTTQQ